MTLLKIGEIKRDIQYPEIVHVSDCDSSDMELTGEFAKLSLIDLHMNYKIEFKEKVPHFVSRVLRQEKS